MCRRRPHSLALEEYSEPVSRPLTADHIQSAYGAQQVAFSQHVGSQLIHHVYLDYSDIRKLGCKRSSIGLQWSLRGTVSHGFRYNHMTLLLLF